MAYLEKSAAGNKGNSQVFSQFSITKLLGSGGFGAVFKAQNKLDKLDYALKISISQGSSGDELKEVQNLAKIPPHKNIVMYKTTWKDSFNDFEIDELPLDLETKNDLRIRGQHFGFEGVVIMMELCGADLRKWLAEHPLVNEIRVLGIFEQAVRAVEHIHNNNLIHRDLKPENIFLSYNDPYTIKVGDLGIATDHLKGTKSQTHTKGYRTRLYIAPEQESSSSYTKSVDIFSLGLILFELFWPQIQPSPVPNGHDWDLLAQHFRDLKYQQKLPPLLTDTWPNISQLILKMTQYEPKSRPDFGTIYTVIKDFKHKLSPSSSKLPETTRSYEKIGTIKMNQYAKFNYGEKFGDIRIPKAYDLETPVNFPLKFHGNNYDYTRIKTDGFIKFDQNDNLPLIALYWAGIDTRDAGSIYYRVTSKIEELDLARVLIERIEPGEIKLTKLLIVTYHEVPFEKAAKTTTNCPGLALRNTFQGILATDDASRFFMIFNYIDLNWGPLKRIEDKFCTGYSETVKVGFRDKFRTQLSFDNTLVVNNQTFSNSDLLTKSNIGFPGVFATRIDEQPTKNFLKFNSTISFGTSNEDSKLPAGYDIEASVNFPFNMYGKLHSALKVHTDGWLYYPDDPTIYIFFTGIDTTYGGSVSYRVSSKFEDLNLAQILIERAHPTNEGIKLTSTFIVTYTDVPFQDVPFWKSSETLAKCPETPRNTFQGILATDGVRSFVIFNFITLNWGGSINQDPCTGFYSYTRAGLHDGENHRLLDNTKGNNEIVGLKYKDLLIKTNIGIPGIIVTRVDQIPPF